VAPVAPPPEREALLARIAPERQKLFRLVRQLVDDLDQAAPWDHLYYPPDEPEAFLGMAAGLLGVAGGIPARISELVQLLSLVAPDDDTRATLEEAEFYFNGIHSMCSHDLQRLRGLLEPFSGTAKPLSAADRNYLCEVAADLKGKYSSALMGASASIAAEGNWSGVDVEPILFPEKQEEFRRNHALVDGLNRVLAAIDELREQVPFPQLVERWRSGARVDPYALADLATFRGILGQLLKRGLRRALYSGDYHQIQHRESALAVRIAELEAVHFHTWSLSAADAIAGSYPRLVQLTFEIAAILDVDLLEELIGSRALRDVRTAVMSETSGNRQRALADELEPLVSLLASEDLQTFLELLLGSVMKRASVTAETRASAAAPLPPVAAAELDETLNRTLRSLGDIHRGESEESDFAGIGDLEGLGDLDDTSPAATEVLPPLDDAALGALGEPGELGAFGATPAWVEPPPPPVAPPAPSVAAQAAIPATPQPTLPPPPVAPSAAPTPPPAAPASVARRRETLERLHEVLAELQAPENHGWSSYRMLQRLLDKQMRIPPSMLQGAHPFVYNVLNNLVPQLESAAAVGAVPAEARRRLVECCMALTSDGITPEQMMREVPTNLARLGRLLEGLHAATAAQLR